MYIIHVHVGCEGRNTVMWGVCSAPHFGVSRTCLYMYVCGLPPEMPLWANTLRVQNEFHVYMYMYMYV